MQFINQATILFTKSDGYDGNHTLGDVNHCIAIMRQNGGCLFINPTPGGVVTRFKLCPKNISQSEKGSPEVDCLESVPDETPIFQEKTELTKELSNLLLNKFKPPAEPLLNTTTKPLFCNATNSRDEIFFYQKLVRRYALHFKPVYIIEVGVYAMPAFDPFYGRPMFCHNYIMHTLGLTLGNVLTTLHLKEKLLDWSGKTNFLAELKYEQKKS